MLPKSKRLTTTDFKGLRTRVIYRGAHFDIARAENNTTKYACVISKKKIRRAVDRNKVRRKIYDALYSIEPASPSFIIIYPTKQTLFAKKGELEDELRTAFATL